MMTFIPISWPEVQNLIDLPGFKENSYAILDDQGVKDFGENSYFINTTWLEHTK